MSNTPDLNGSLGATQIGAVLGTFLFGIETLQTYNYYGEFPRDSRTLKMTVALVWFLELGHTLSAWHALYSQTVTFYGQLQYISSPPRSEEMTILFAALLYTVVQAFFANRVRVLSGRWNIMFVACCLNLLRFVANMATLGLLLYYSRVSILLEWRWLVSTALGLGIVVDILITVAMCHFLWRLRSSDSKRTRTMVETLILWTIESTILTSAASIIQLILFLTRTDLVWTCFYIIQAKLFSNSMLASLNGRRRFRACEDEPFEFLHFVHTGGSTTGGVSCAFGESGSSDIYGKQIAISLVQREADRDSGAMEFK
ncbi:hypothetical protein B0H17DRAFT_677112 [Mycena rosella]|uniref:DUF6534 domain-containing protein n=1 Tax=Mycena rosella TaxID=1033263 RepID=A0AAD7DCD9_MYCRO|nr:hypothetical protein B0H17DRAFT_677112 [Mycena rosella]